MGLYRDGGLIILHDINNQQTDKIRENISIFKSIDFKIEFITNLTEVGFLNVTFNLERNTYQLYKKSQMLTYMHIP